MLPDEENLSASACISAARLIKTTRERRPDFRLSQSFLSSSGDEEAVRYVLAVVEVKIVTIQEYKKQCAFMTYDAMLSEAFDDMLKPAQLVHELRILGPA